MDKLIKSMASCVTSFSFSLVSQVVFFMVKTIYLVLSNWFIAANIVVMNSYTNTMDSNAKLMNSIAKSTNSIANRLNSIAKATNSTTNGTKSIAKEINSIAKAYKVPSVQTATI